MSESRWEVDEVDRRDPTPEELEVLLLGGAASMGRRDISRAVSVPTHYAQRFWHALGFPIVPDDEEQVFADADLKALRRVADLVRVVELDLDTALGTTRAFGRTMDRLAVWQTQLMAEALSPSTEQPGLGEKDSRSVDHEAALLAAQRLAELADDLEPLLVYVWRRHLTAAIARMLADADPGLPGVGPYRMVGFADLVSFTSLVRRLTERQLAVMVQRFEQLASDVVTAHGGRVIKTVGDEVLFVTIGPAPAAAIALDLVEAMAEDTLLPEARVGMAAGHVVSRMGDVFGTTVNRAARLTAVAPAGGVLVDDAFAGHLSTISGFQAVPQRRRALRGIGLVQPSLLRRATGERA